MAKMKFYSGKNIRAKNALYNVIFGERSNGKTFDVLREAFREYIDSGEQNQLALVRRWDEDFVGANSARTSYDALMHDGNGKNQIKIISDGKYDGVEYYAGKYFLTVYDPQILLARRICYIPKLDFHHCQTANKRKNIYVRKHSKPLLSVLQRNGTIQGQNNEARRHRRVHIRGKRFDRCR